MAPYCSQSDSGRRKANESAIAGVWLMYRVGMVVAKLAHDLADALIVLVAQRVADKSFEPM